jgi:glycosyltransferase involved in cell wall biosynthesis
MAGLCLPQVRGEGGRGGNLRIGFVGVSPSATTGYGTQTRHIIRGLMEKHEVWSIAHEAGGSFVVWGGNKTYRYPDGTEVPVLVMTSPLSGPANARDILADYCRKHRLDLLIGHWDAFALDFLNEQPVPWLAYAPVEGELTDSWADCVANASRTVAYSRYGYGQFARFLPRSRLAYIPHGVDTGLFRPGRVDKAGLAAEPRIPGRCFLFTCVGTNNGPRKQLPLLMDIFARLAREPGRADAHLYLHTNAGAPMNHGYDLLEHARRLGIADRVHFPEDNPLMAALPDGEMARVYQASDCAVTASLGEGFGLPVLEAMACGLPAIAPANSSHTELVGADRGWLADCVPADAFMDYPVYTPYGSRFPVPDARSLLARMREAYDDAPARVERGERAREFALGYDWSRVMPRWLGLLEEVEQEVRLFADLKAAL